MFIKRVQTNICEMIGDATSGKHPVVAVNNTREVSSGEVMVKDADSGEILLATQFSVTANSKKTIGSIPATNKQAMWLVEYSSGKDRYSSHYLNDKTLFYLDDNIQWYKKLNIVKI